MKEEQNDNILYLHDDKNDEDPYAHVRSLRFTDTWSLKVNASIGSWQHPQEFYFFLEWITEDQLFIYYLLWP